MIDAVTGAQAFTPQVYFPATSCTSGVCSAPSLATLTNDRVYVWYVNAWDGTQWSTWDAAEGSAFLVKPPALLTPADGAPNVIAPIAFQWSHYAADSGSGVRDYGLDLFRYNTTTGQFEPQPRRTFTAGTICSGTTCTASVGDFPVTTTPTVYTWRVVARSFNGSTFFGETVSGFRAFELACFPGAAGARSVCQQPTPSTPTRTPSPTLTPSLHPSLAGTLTAIPTQLGAPVNYYLKCGVSGQQGIYKARSLPATDGNRSDGYNFINFGEGSRVTGYENQIDVGLPNEPPSPWIRVSQPNAYSFPNTTGPYSAWIRIGTDGNIWFATGTPPANCPPPGPTSTQTKIPFATPISLPTAVPCATVESGWYCPMNASTSDLDVLTFILACEADNAISQPSVGDIAHVIRNRMRSGSFYARTPRQVVSQVAGVPAFDCLNGATPGTPVHGKPISQIPAYVRTIANDLINGNYINIPFTDPRIENTALYYVGRGPIGDNDNTLLNLLYKACEPVTYLDHSPYPFPNSNTNFVNSFFSSFHKCGTVSRQ